MSKDRGVRTFLAFFKKGNSVGRTEDFLVFLVMNEIRMKDHRK